MTEAEISNRLLNRAGALLARRPHSRGELRRRLLPYAEEQLVEAILDRLEDLKLLNDSEYAYNLALCRMRQQGWGPLRVLESLRRREVPAGVAESALERVHRETDELKVLEGYLQRHASKHGVPGDRKGIGRLVSHLRRRGFQDGAIFDALRRRIPAAAWRRFETGDSIDQQ